MLEQIETKDIRKNDVFMERSSYGDRDVYVALEDARHRIASEDHDIHGWGFVAREVVSGKEIEFFIADGWEHYSDDKFLLVRED